MKSSSGIRVFPRGRTLLTLVTRKSRRRKEVGHKYLKSCSLSMERVFRPISWKEGTQPLTRLELQKRNGTHVLDTTTGGGTLFISYVRPLDTGIYKCYVNNKLVGLFRLGLFSTAQPRVQDETYGFIESVAVGSSLFLLFLMLLSILEACHRIRR